MATAIVERNDFSARAPIEHDRPLQNGAGELPTVDQFVIPGRDIPGISQEDSVVRHDALPVACNASLWVASLGHRRFRENPIPLPPAGNLFGFAASNP
jgi:hypothetical protein